MTPDFGEVANLIEPAWLRPHRSMLALSRRRDDRHPIDGVADPEAARDLETAHLRPSTIGGRIASTNP
jgi:hypothetical protein